MAREHNREHKGKSAVNLTGRSKGMHGGNRSGNQDNKADTPRRSSQAAGKDPLRGKSH